MGRRRIALIGYGAIGAELAQGLLAAGHDVSVLLRPDSASRGRVSDRLGLVSDMAELAAARPELVVEAAGHGAVQQVVPACLEAGLPVLISSIGALHDAALYDRLVTTARDHGGRLLLPSGALGALDYVRAVRHAGALSLRYQSRKPPSAWSAELAALGHDPSALAAPVTLFAGNAREAAALYPQNLNVAAALALAGQGFEATGVEVICDPAAGGNTHVVLADSEFGEMRLSIVNKPSPANPKSSWIVGRSLMAAIDQYFSPVMML
jgi:aspartate dehydrogenase